MDVVDIYFAALQLGKYPPPFTFTSVNHSYYQIFNFKWCASSVLLVCSTLVISSCSESPYMEMRCANCCQAEHYLNNYRLIDHLPCHWPFTMSYSSYTHGIIMLNICSARIQLHVHTLHIASLPWPTSP